MKSHKGSCWYYCHKECSDKERCGCFSPCSKSWCRCCSLLIVRFLCVCVVVVATTTWHQNQEWRYSKKRKKVANEFTPFAESVCSSLLDCIILCTYLCKYRRESFLLALQFAGRFECSILHNRCMNDYPTLCKGKLRSMTHIDKKIS